MGHAPYIRFLVYLPRVRLLPLLLPRLYLGTDSYPTTSSQFNAVFSTMSTEPPPRQITLPNHRLRKWAQHLLTLHLHLSHPQTPPPTNSPKHPTRTRIVCISDTHNNKPFLPHGDILIHAGDLTENGSFDELQAQIHWLSAQPHRHKIVVAGNHDVLLDEHFLDRYPERRYGSRKTKRELDWGGCDLSSGWGCYYYFDAGARAAAGF